MTKTGIITELAIRSGLKKTDILRIVDGFLECIIESSNKNEQVEIRGFGTFHRVEKRERTVNSPIAGKKIEVPAKTVLGFKASKMTEKVLENKEGA